MTDAYEAISVAEETRKAIRKADKLFEQVLVSRYPSCLVDMVPSTLARTLPDPLRIILEIIHISGPSPEHFEGLIGRILGDLARRWELPLAAMPEFPRPALRALRDMSARTRSVGRLQRHIEAVIAALIPGYSRPVH